MGHVVPEDDQSILVETLSDNRLFSEPLLLKETITYGDTTNLPLLQV